VIITSDKPYTKQQIEKLKEQFDVYIKTVIDVDRKVCSAGCDRHFDSEQVLLKQDSKQESIWGGGVDLETKMIDFNSFINIRPGQDNRSNEIQNSKVRDKYEKLTKFFFQKLYGEK